MLKRLVSGGQTGVDRGALDAALAAGFPCGGWCPRGRRAEDGPIPPRYPLCETESPAYRVRTVRNVRDSDATLLLLHGPPEGGTRLTRDAARRMGRPCRCVRLPAGEAEARRVARWLAENRVEVLNVAGPRESKAPGIRAQAKRFVAALLSLL